MLKSSAVRYRHRTVLARHVFFSCCWAAGGAAPGATAARWRSSSGVTEFSPAFPEQVIPIQLAGKNFADAGGDFGGDLDPSATDEQLLFGAWKVFVCRRHYFPRESATWKYYAICADTAGGSSRAVTGECRANYVAKKSGMARAVRTRRPIFSRRARKSFESNPAAVQTISKIFVVLKKKYLRFAPGTQGAGAPVFDGIQKNSRPQSAS